MNKWSRLIKVILFFVILFFAFIWANTNATSWYSNFSDDFNRADSSSMGNSWDEGPGTHAIVSNRLSINTAGNPWVEGITKRPDGESALDQRMTVQIPAGVDISGSSLWISLRTHARGTEYILGLDHASARFAKSVGGSLGFLSDGVAVSGYDSGHAYLIDVSVVGTSPTTLNITVTDQNTSTVVLNETMTDSTAELQSAGSAGFFTVGAITLDNVTIYDTTSPPATSYALSGPTAGQINTATTNFTITPDGLYTGTITPSDNGAGGTFTPSSATFSNSNTPATFTYTPASTGTKTISVAASPALGTDPSSISVVVTTLPPGEISIVDPEIIWSPYNWRFNGSSWVQTTAGGAYLKVAFTGSTLALGVSTSTNTGVDLSTIKVHAYIDGSGSPVTKTLADLSATGVLTFSSALSAGSHYAIIYLSQTSQSYDRWTTPVDVLRITKIQLVADGTGAVSSLSSTPLARKTKKIIIFGDSITEGVGTTQAENAYSAVLGQTLGVEYGQIGYGGLGWSTGGSGNMPVFYNTSTSVWRMHDSSATRMTNNSNLSEGFADGIPNAVFINMGTNDMGGNMAQMRSRLTAWITDVRTAVGPSPAIFVIMPFRFSRGDMPNEHAAISGGLSDYQDDYPSDWRTYMLDLGSGAYDTVVAGGDGLHPDNTGSATLGGQLADLSEDYIITPVTTVSSVTVTPDDDSADFTWTTDSLASSLVDYGLTSSYVGTSTEAHNSTSTRTTNHSISLTGLASCTKYHYRVRSRDIVPNNASSTDSTFTTTGCTGSATVSSSVSESISGSGSLTAGDLTLTIPNSFSNTATDAVFQANVIDSTAFFLSAGTPSGKTAVGTFVVKLSAISDSLASLSTFATPLTVTISYNPSDIGSLTESALKIYRYDNGTGWTALSGCSVNTTAHTVTCTTNHFSDFAIFGEIVVSSDNGGGGGGGGNSNGPIFGTTLGVVKLITPTIPNPTIVDFPDLPKKSSTEPYVAQKVTTLNNIPKNTNPTKELPTFVPKTNTTATIVKNNIKSEPQDYNVPNIKENIIPKTEVAKDIAVTKNTNSNPVYYIGLALNRLFSVIVSIFK